MGKTFWYAMLAYLALEFISLLGHASPVVSQLGLAAITAAALTVSVVNLRWGATLVLAELFIGGKGYLLSLPIGSSQLSLRMALWLVVLSVWIGRRWMRGNQKTPAPASPGVSMVVWLLAATVAAGIIQGLLRYPFHQVFFDANAWLFFLLLPLFLASFTTRRHLEIVLQILAAAVVVQSVKTLTLLYLFGHVNVALLTPIYQWVRDSGVGEITHVDGSLFRVFFQSHLYALVAWVAMVSLLVSRTLRGRREMLGAAIVAYLASLSLIISQSRSLWVGAAAGLGWLLVTALIRGQLHWWRALAVAALLVVIVQSQFSATALISGNVGANIIKQRWSDLGNEPASSSRRSQLRPLIAAVAERPLLGSGFGRQVSYQSDDPRVRLSNPGGWYTTSAFEWGYLDMALKIGGLGLAWYLWWLAQVIAPLGKRGNDAGSQALRVGLFAIAVTSMFSPYLNHPLGIGWVMLVAASHRRELQPSRAPTNVG